MKIWKIVLSGLLLAGSASAMAGNGGNPLDALHWQKGPTTAQVGDKAQVAVPEGYVFLGSKDTKKFLTLNHDLSDGRQYLLAPISLKWFSIFEFDAVGYVKDNNDIDADALLKSVQENTRRSNEERRKRGWGTMSITGWRFRPKYDDTSHLLEWAFMGRDDESGSPIVNYNTRLLGRTGVMRVVLVAAPTNLDSAVSNFKTVLGGYQFDDGQRYAQYQKGDKVAEYGLAALIAGGAAAVAAKKGLFTIIGGALVAGWKFLLAGLAAVGAWLKSRFKRKA
jgi:uncharacterized membrane-anchored protein